VERTETKRAWSSSKKIWRTTMCNMQRFRAPDYLNFEVLPMKSRFWRIHNSTRKPCRSSSGSSAALQTLHRSYQTPRHAFASLNSPQRSKTGNVLSFFSLNNLSLFNESLYFRALFEWFYITSIYYFKWISQTTRNDQFNCMKATRDRLWCRNEVRGL
jgi:hypothetical protein